MSRSMTGSNCGNVGKQVVTKDIQLNVQVITMRKATLLKIGIVLQSTMMVNFADSNVFPRTIKNSILVDSMVQDGSKDVANISTGHPVNTVMNENVQSVSM